MASCSSSSISLLQPLHSLSSSTLFFSQPSFHFSSSLKPNKSKRHNLSKSLTLRFALTESDSTKPLEIEEPSSKSLLLQLSKCFDLPSDYFQQLPNDLRLDLNDAAFDLSNGPVIDEVRGYDYFSTEFKNSYSICGIFYVIFMYLNYMCMLFLHCSLNSMVNKLSSAMQFYIPTFVPA
ncbi:unnamed protein product [Arabidopsis thaliana]|uniref:Uncharacterized protein n=1 Tax=Arabidopsis thaliana TaxID=3702 RepID=Q9FHS9_ARATH|nr:unnamed protein product [Arabidopsis thaliana]